MKTILPGDSMYDSARKTIGSNGEPSSILYPTSASEVIAALHSTKGKRISVRSGGHSVAGFASNMGGIVIDLSGINTIEVVDPEKNTVRIGAGATWGEVALTLESQNLALSSGDTKSVGVGGLTLGGGIGWMVRKYGLTIDSLVAAEIVTVDGNILRVSESEHKELFWAISGGGGNFGIVTYFDFQAHPSKNVFAGMLMYGLENLPELLKGWRDYMRIADESLTTCLMIMPAFMGNPPGVMITLCYAGDDEKMATNAIEPLKKLGPITMQNIGLKKYSEVLEEAHPPEGIKVVVKNVFIEKFHDEVINTIVSIHKQTPSLLLQFRSLGGAMKRIPNETTAFSFHSSEVMILAPIFVPVTASSKEIEIAVTPWESIATFGCGSYSGFLSDASEKEVTAIYPKPTYDRLVTIKKIYDPENRFTENYNIKPN